MLVGSAFQRYFSQGLQIREVLMPDKIQIPHGQCLGEKSRSAIESEPREAKMDVVTELECSPAVEELVDSTDVARQKKIAALKKQHQEGKLVPQASADVAEKIIKKFNL